MFQYDDSHHTIETERLLLRSLVSADAPRVAAICHTEEVYRGTLALPHPYTEDSAMWWINHRDECSETNLAVTDKWTGELYGCMGLAMDVHSRMGEIGYRIDPYYWNQGIATEAAKAIIRFGFDVQQLHKINGRFLPITRHQGVSWRKPGWNAKDCRKSTCGKSTDLRTSFSTSSSTQMVIYRELQFTNGKFARLPSQLKLR